MEVGAKFETDANKRGDLHEQLRQTADQSPERETNQGATAEVRIEQ